jgi:hypothetical protein
MNQTKDKIVNTSELIKKDGKIGLTLELLPKIDDKKL